MAGQGIDADGPTNPDWGAPTLAGASTLSPSAELELGRGATLGRYLVIERLGAGGMGVVYAAYDPELDRKLAVKLLRPEAGGDPELGRARLIREAQAMAKLAHPNVVAVHDVGTFGEQVFVAMEFVQGGTLTGWLAAGEHGWREVLGMFLETGRGLAAAHAAGVVHRDFKPESGPESQASENTSISRLRRGCVPTLYQADEPVNTEQGENDRRLRRAALVVTRRAEQPSPDRLRPWRSPAPREPTGR